jgi:hypothetical protein
VAVWLLQKDSTRRRKRVKRVCDGERHALKGVAEEGSGWGSGSRPHGGRWMAVGVSRFDAVEQHCWRRQCMLTAKAGWRTGEGGRACATQGDGAWAADVRARARGTRWTVVGVQKRGRRHGTWMLMGGSRWRTGSGLNDFKLFRIKIKRAQT